jgi:hypothetical protein
MKRTIGAVVSNFVAEARAWFVMRRLALSERTTTKTTKTRTRTAAST